VVTYSVNIVYKAFSGSYRMPAIAIITALSIKKYMPIGLSCKRDKTIAKISIPPVEAPNYTDNQTPAPLITPPNTALTIITSDKEITGNISKNTVENITETIL